MAASGSERRGGLRAEVLELAVRECEEACRAHAAACLAAADAGPEGVVGGDNARVELVMDCAYTSSATARALRHFDRDDADTATMLLTACARLAPRCAEACDRGAAQGALELCARLGRECAAACVAVLELLHVRVAVQAIE